LDTSNHKPDLMAPVHGAQASGIRILASLEQGGTVATQLKHTARWKPDRWTAGMGLAVIVLAVLAWTTRQTAIQHPTPGQASFSTQVAAVPPPESATAPQAGPVLQAATSEAAIIVAEHGGQPVAQTVAQPAVQPVAPGRPPAAGGAPAGLRGAALERNATPGPVARSTPAPAHASPSASLAQRSRPVPASTETNAAGASPDTDVALLTALVAHAGAPTNVAPERSRDVVLRQEGEGTAPLLARCKQLGLIEGMLCRSRICSGRWESEAACRAPSH
jgi:hypothetical protein